MNSKGQQLPFSIDFITRESMDNNVDELDNFSSYGTGSSEGDSSPKGPKSRQTPSPSDSGMESDQSPSRPDLQKQGKDNSIAEVLLSLEKNISRTKVKVTHEDDSSEEKPVHSYIALISMAILSTPERRMLLSDIYQYVMDRFPYYNNSEKAWRNSIRHNLSLNECFIKAGRADNGKGNYWSIHPACIEDFANGDFRRRQARRRARKSMKDTCHTASAYRYNVGYVPMTASNIAYHPYSSAAAAAAASSLYYQQTQGFMPVGRAPQTSLPSAFSVGQSQTSTNYLSACALSSQSSPHSTMSIAFPEQPNQSALTMQAFAQQQLASSLQFQNW